MRWFEGSFPAGVPGRGRLAALLPLLAGFVMACGGDAGAHDARPSPPRMDSVSAPLVRGGDSALVRAAREVLPEVQEESGLEAMRPLAVARTTAERLRSYLLGKLREELPPERARAVQETYARLGLLPDSLDLPGLLRKLYLEQVVGYYDPKRDTLYVREGVSDAEFRPVLVHEMVHALQDEHTNLDSLLRAREDDNDAASAARAALEGHATYVMLEWQLGQSLGRRVDLTSMPSIAGLLSGANVLSAGAAAMPELASAPPFIQQSLLFPYLDGLSFMQAMWKARPGRPAPLGSDMPASTEQVLHPGRFLSEPRDAPSAVDFVSDSASVAGGWRDVHSDDLGEFETRFFLSTFLGDTARARSAATGWDGDRYRLLRRCPGAPGGGRPPAGASGALHAGAEPPCAEALVWASVWDDPGSADAFAAAVRVAFRARYGAARVGVRTRSGAVTGGSLPAAGADSLARAGRVVAVRRTEQDGRPAVVVVDRPIGADPAPIASAARFRVGGGG